MELNQDKSEVSPFLKAVYNKFQDPDILKYRIMRIRLSLFGILIISLVYSCKQRNQVKDLQNEVMSIHDEVMPEMGTLMKLKKQLKDTISHLDSTKQTVADSLNLIVEQLEEADEAMMQWMRNYKAPTEEMPPEEALQYLQLKKKEIIEVRDKIYNSEASARTALQN